MKWLVELLENVIWWIARFCLWCAVLIGPAWMVALALQLCGGVSGSFFHAGIRITKPSDLLYVMVTVGVTTVAGYVYMFRFRESIDQRRDVRYILVSCVLVSLCMTFHFEARYLRRLVVEATPIDVELSFVDADTGKPLHELSVDYPDPEALPKPFFTMSSDFSSRPGTEGCGYKIRGVGVPGVTYDFTFSADGYEAKQIRVGIDTQSGEIKLKRKPDALGNETTEAQ